MSYYFATWHTHITKKLAKAEPEAQRLFNRPPRPISPATRALLARIVSRNSAEEGSKRESKAHRASTKRKGAVSALGRDRGRAKPRG